MLLSYSDPMFRRGISTSELSMNETTPPSSAESDADPVTSSTRGVDRVMGLPVSRPGLGMRLPPLESSSPPKRISKALNHASSTRYLLRQNFNEIVDKLIKNIGTIRGDYFAFLLHCAV